MLIPLVMFSLLAAAAAGDQPMEMTATVLSHPVTYRDRDLKLVGFLAVPKDTSPSSKRPGVLVVHEWWGLTDFTRERAKRLADLGYVALAVDMYGNGQTTTKADEAAKLSGQFKNDPALWRRRAKAGFDALAIHPAVDPQRIAVIGYCFGGSTALQLSYAGVPLAGAVSFHGGLMPPAENEGKQIRARLLILHGADDPLVPADSITATQAALSKAGVDWQMISYGRAVHSFTNPAAGGVGIKGVAYDADADRRSWQDMRQFFDEIFAAGEKSGR